jgi:hypothetical protein
MEKVIFLLDMESTFFMVLNWYIFPERHLRAVSAGICVSSNHDGSPPFPYNYSSCFAGNTLDSALFCRRGAAFEWPRVKF